MKRCANPECDKPFAPNKYRPGAVYCCKTCRKYHYNQTHKKTTSRGSQKVCREKKEEIRAGKPLSSEFLAKWWTLVAIEKQKTIEEREAREKPRKAVCVPLCVEEGEDLEDWVEVARRPKTGLHPAITCHCGRTVVPGSGRCWRHVGEEK